MPVLLQLWRLTSVRGKFLCIVSFLLYISQLHTKIYLKLAIVGILM